MDTERRPASAERQELGFLVDQYYAVQSLRVKASNRVDAIERRGTVPRDIVEAHQDFVNQRMKVVERELAAKIELLVKGFALWSEWLENLKGMGPVLAGGCLAKVDPVNFPNPSKLWRYAGMAVIDGAAERYVTGELAHFVRKLRTHSWKIADSFVKQGDGYQLLYRAYRRELAQWGIHARSVPDQVGAWAIGYSKATAWNEAVRIALSQRAKFPGGRGAPTKVEVTVEKEKRSIPLAWKAIDALDEKWQEAVILAYLEPLHEARLDWERPCAKAGPHFGYKKDQETGRQIKVELPTCTDAHKDAKAKRKMVKVFWKDYWTMGLQLEGFETPSPFAVKYGHSLHPPIMR